MNVWGIEAPGLLDCLCKTCIVRLSQNLLDQFRVRHLIDDPWNKVACQAVWCRQIHREMRRGERTILHTTSTSAAGDIQAILLGCRYNAVAVSSEASVGLEDFGVKSSGRSKVLRFSIQ
jgi:hypothetical protein